MKMPNVILGNLAGQLVATIISPFFNGTEIKHTRFDGVKKIGDIFPDAALATFIAKQLKKSVSSEILCEELYLIQNFIYKGKEKKEIIDFTGLEYLGNLRIFRITHHHHMTVIPQQLRYIYSLRVLEISSGNLDAIEAWVFQLPKIQKINFSHQKIVAIPDTIIQAKRIVLLNFSNNKIENIPSIIGKIKSLEVLNISYNPIHQLPTEIMYLNKLRRLDVSNTQLVSLPTSLGFVKELDYLDIRNTRIEQIDSILKQRMDKHLIIHWNTQEIKVFVYPKNEYNESHIFPSATIASSIVGFTLIGMGIASIKRFRIEKGGNNQ